MVGEERGTKDYRVPARSLPVKDSQDDRLCPEKQRRHEELIKSVSRCIVGDGIVEG